MELTGAVEALGALAQGSRLEVFRLLVQAGPTGLAAGAIGKALELPGPTLSFHLSQLRNVGLISSRRAGRSLIYVADYGVMNELLAFLTENCCQGNTAGCDPICCDPSITAHSPEKEIHDIAY